ncbi:glycosyltransferase family 4 protein [Citricoccus zhacaiensis]
MKKDRNGFGGYLSLEDAGSTYTAEEKATYLQLELGHLKQALFDVPLPPWPKTGFEEEDTVAAPGRVADYAASVEKAFGQEDGAPFSGVRHLVVVNQYPRIGDEYGNGFVHRRVKYYLEAGVQVHVAVVAPNAEPESYVYDGVPVLVGRGAEARELLRSVDYASISSHFLNIFMWEQIRDDLEGHRWFTFMHGFESRRWVRTIRNYRSPEPLSNGIKDSLTRQRFWREVLSHPNGPERVVFVSRWWRRGSQDDLELVFPAQRSAVVHNVTDTDLFRFQEKDPEQRYQILWVRSAANLNYAPDLAVRALEALRETRFWPQLQVRIIGDGMHFGAFEEAFADDDNVQVERRFASQEEIARLHRDYGVFLVPSRWDSQGVSRDEAMASGLVPVTNAVCAIPEFVDDDCAIVAGPEDVTGMVEGMVRLFQDPKRFQQMSRAAALRVAEQSGPEHTVRAEMRLMGMLREHDGHPATPVAGKES